MLKGSAGLLLLLFPLLTSRALGLDKPANGFWPRLVGGILLGVAIAVGLEMARAPAGGLGMLACVVINVVGAGVILAQLVLTTAAPSRRGRALLGMMVGVLLVLSAFEIAHV